MEEERRAPLWLGLWPTGLFLLFGLAAAFIVPRDYRDPRPTPPDEAAHVGYVIWLAREHRLPVFLSLKDNYEGHQAPLYYLSGLPVFFIYAALQRRVPEGAEPGLVLALRIWSVFLAGGGIWVVWLLGRRVFVRSPLLSLAPAFFLALWPARTLIVSAVTNDGLAEALSIATLLACACLLEERLTRRRAAILGFVWGLSLLAKSSTLALAPVIVLTFAIAAMRGPEKGQGSRESLRGKGWEILTAGVLFLFVTVAVAGWWFVRNQLIYGDPLAAKTFNRLFKIDRATPEYFYRLGLSGGDYLLLVVINTALSFWGVYGQANVYAPLIYYGAGLAIWLAASGGFLRQRIWPQEEIEDVTQREAKAYTKRAEARENIFFRRKCQAGVSEKRWRLEGGWRSRFWLLCWLLIATVAVFFLRFNMEFYQAQARYLFPANGAMACLLIRGLWDWDRRRYGLRLVGIGLGIVALMGIYSVFGYRALTAAYYPHPLATDGQ